QRSGQAPCHAGIVVAIPQIDHRRARSAVAEDQSEERREEQRPDEDPEQGRALAEDALQVIGRDRQDLFHRLIFRLSSQAPTPRTTSAQVQSTPALSTTAASVFPPTRMSTMALCAAPLGSVVASVRRNGGRLSTGTKLPPSS